MSLGTLLNLRIKIYKEKILFPRTTKILTNSIIFWTVSIITILLIRMPGLSRGSLNPDEDEWIINAISLINYPIEWVSTSFNVTRPLTVLPLTLIKIFGVGVTNASAQMLVILINVLMLWFLYRIFILISNNEALSRLIILPWIVMYSLFTLWDYTAYNSEHICCFTIVLILWLMVQSAFKEQKSKIIYFLIGFLLGLLPYIKIQCIVIGCSIGFSFLIYLLLSKEKIWHLVTGVLLPQIIVLLQSYLTKDFTSLKYKIVNTFTYATKDNFADSTSQYLEQCMNSVVTIYSVIDSKPFILWISLIYITCILLIIYHYFTNKHSPTLEGSWISITLILYVSTSFYAIHKPPHAYPHYVLLILPAFILISGHSVLVVSRIFSQNNYTKKLFTRIILVTFTFFVSTSSFYVFKNGNIAFYELEKNLQIAKNKDPLSRAILELGQPNDKLAVWGWNNELYLRTMMHKGTRFVYTYKIHDNWPSSSHDLKLFNEDIVKMKPSFFIDVYDLFGNQNFSDNKKDHKYSDLRKTIADFYIHRKTVNGIDIFQLKDLKEI